MAKATIHQKLQHSSNKAIVEMFQFHHATIGYIASKPPSCNAETKTFVDIYLDQKQIKYIKKNVQSKNENFYFSCLELDISIISVHVEHNNTLPNFY